MVADLVREEPNHDLLIFDGGDSFYDIGSSNVIRARGFWHALMICFRSHSRYDFFHLHMVPSCYLALFLRKRAVIHVHNSHYERWTSRWIRWLDRLTYRCAAGTICVSEDARDAIAAIIGKSTDIHILENFSPKLTLSDRVPDKREGEFEILMVAAFDGPKRQDVLIAALQFLPVRFRVLLVGDGANLSHCKSVAQNAGVSSRVEFAGFSRDVASSYARADLCALISEWEGFGLVILEAAQFGKMTVMSDVGGLRNNCPDPRLIFKGYDAEKLAEKILSLEKLVVERDMAETMKRHWKAHSLEGYVQRLDKIYS